MVWFHRLNPCTDNNSVNVFRFYLLFIHSAVLTVKGLARQSWNLHSHDVSEKLAEQKLFENGSSPIFE